MVETDSNKLVGRRERKREATRNAIVAAAAVLFGEKDYDSVTVDEIAERADVVKGTFYAHFPAKEDLASAVYNASIHPAAAEVESLLAAERPAIVALEALLHVATRQAEANPRLARTVYSHGMSQAYSQNDDSEKASEFVALMERIVAYGQKNGELRHDVASGELAVLLCVLYATTVWSWAANASREPLEVCVDRCLRIALEGMGRGKASSPERAEA